MNEKFSLDFPRAWGTPLVFARFRVLPEDFCVDEHLGFEPAGEGEHVFLHLKKRGENTAWVAQQLASLAGVRPLDVGYAGRKDRHAVTTQWFSVYLPGKAPVDWSAIERDSIQLLRVARHTTKLRPGDHAANDFVIRLRDLRWPGDAKTGPADLDARLQQIAREGVPNYFGEQRFGHQSANLMAAETWLVRESANDRRRQRKGRDRDRQGLWLSAARAWLFNQILAARVLADNWRQALPGDPEPEATGALWGRGRNPAKDDCALLEAQALEPWVDWCQALEHQGLQQERRPLRLLPLQLSWAWDGADLVLRFRLDTGQFATAFLRELAWLEKDATGGSDPVDRDD